MAISEAAARELAALSAVVLTHTDLTDALPEICRIATRAVPGVDGASVTTFPQGRPGAVASDTWAQNLDELQYVEHEGPCLDAYRTGNMFRVRDLANEPRWPSYMPRAVEHGARSMISIPLAAEGSVIGALNFYSKEPDRFGAEEASIAEVVAAHAGLAVQVTAAFFRHRDLAEQLREAMQSRATIEQAKGIVMARERCTADRAFELLTKMSQNANRKLRDIAAEVVASATAQ
jgi:GAF domain-containing protein